MKIRDVFESFEAYGWETPTHKIAEETGLRPQEIVRLDTNTSPYRPRGALAELAMKVRNAEVNQYPDTSYHELARGLSAYTGKGIGRFVITNGADEGLDIISKVVIDPGSEVLAATPTYPMYRITAEIMGARVRVIPRKPNFGLDIEKMVGAVNEKTRAIFLCNPNNPTGNYSPEEEVEELAERTGVMIAIDEAYFEYCGRSAIELTDRLENVVVCRTFSKAFSLAGARIGYLVAREDTIGMLNMVRPPNSVTVLSLILGQAALSRISEMRKVVRKTLKERERLFGMLGDVEGIEPFPSVANFILFRVEEAEPDKVHQRLMRKGLVLRNLSKVPGVEGCLRTTVGTPEVNDRLVAELRRALR